MSKKTKIVTLADGTKVLDELKRRAMSSFRFQIPTQVTTEATRKVLDAASLCYYNRPPKNAVQDNVPVPTEPGSLKLSADRYIEVEFRALSAVFLNQRGLDFSRPGVLEAAVPMLQGKTVYPNHQFQDIYNWLGVVSESFWDAKGDKADGVPGINCKVKIDAFLNYRIACGLMMNPPAVNAMSLTVVFEFEYSHPQMERWRFWELLGEEVDGEVVRLIVTKIIEFWEASLVPVGEDRMAIHQGNIEEDPDDESGDESFSAADPNLPANSNEEKTMKLDKEKKAKLGIEFDGDDVPETELLKAAEALAAQVTTLQPTNLAELTAKSELADKLLGEKRDEVVRLAKLAELGAAEGELEPVVAETIADAGFERLQSLHTYYQKKAAERFPQTGRSSFENNGEIENAGNGKKPAGSKGSVNGMF
ncbi:MAG: hypothetical protein JSS81_05870 [Acidobacteria bacterium]|nr:hypothetical protein [Acidobacteriota bacterium]